MRHNCHSHNRLVSSIKRARRLSISGCHSSISLAGRDWVGTGICGQVLYWNVQPGGKVPLLRDAEPFVVTNNLLVKNKMNKGNDAPWQLHATPIVTWKGYTPATFERNILVVNLSRTNSSQSVFITFISART